MELSIMLEDPPDEPDTYIINIDNFAPPIVCAAIPSTNYDVFRWVQHATITDNMETVGIQAEPLGLNPRLIRDRLQPCLSVLIICLNTPILVLRLRRCERVPAVLINLILHNNKYTLVGMDILSMRRSLIGIAGLPDDILPKVKNVRDIVVLHTGREELRTARLKTIMKEVLDFVDS